MKKTLAALPVLALFVACGENSTGPNQNGANSGGDSPTSGGSSSGGNEQSGSGGSVATGSGGESRGGSGGSVATGSGGESSGGSVATGSGGASSGGLGNTGATGGEGSGGANPACEMDFDTGETPSSSDRTTSIDPAQTYQTTEGWGTSLCWFGNIVGGWSEQKRLEVSDLLFDEENGLGLNVVRYNIGGGENPGHNHMGAGREMPGFKATEDSEYDFSADARQVQMLTDAIDRISENELIIEAFSNSPPYWMTQSGCAAGASGGGDNLKTDYYDDFADYLSDVTLHFRDQLGIVFRTLEPLNEPNGTWWTEGNGQEGCHFDRPSQARIIGELRSSLDERGLTEVEVSAPDETSIDDTVATYESFDMTTRDIVQQINTHAYHGSQRAELRALADRDGKRLWSSEIDGSGAPAPFDQHLHGHNDMISGLDLAQRIVLDLRGMQIDAFVFWQAVESEQGQTNLKKNWGLLHADFENGTEEYFVTKKYHVMRQYTSSIRPGDVMIDIDDQDAVAFFNESEGKLVIVQRNASQDASTVDFDLSGFSRLNLSSIRRTSPSEEFAEVDLIPITQGHLVAPIAPQSVTTFVFECVATE